LKRKGGPWGAKGNASLDLGDLIKGGAILIGGKVFPNVTENPDGGRSAWRH